MLALPSWSWELTTRAPWHDLLGNVMRNLSGASRLAHDFWENKLVETGWNLPGLRLLVVAPVRGFGYGSTGKKSWNRKFEAWQWAKFNHAISQTLVFSQWLHRFPASSPKDYGEAFEEGDIIGTETQEFTKFHQVPETWEVAKLAGNIYKLMNYAVEW